MNKQFLLSLLFFISLNINNYAQRVISEGVTSSYISFPEINIEENSISNFEASMAIENSEYNKELFSKEVACTPLKGSLKDTKMTPLYFYNIEVTRGDGFFMIKDKKGNIFYSEQFSDGMRKELLVYGKEDCKFYLQQLLEEDYKENNHKWILEDQQRFIEKEKTNLNNSIRDRFTLYYKSDSFRVYSGKGRKFDFSELDQAQEQAINAYNNINQTGLNQESMNLLKAPIKIWTSIVEEINWEDKKAKYNHHIGKAVLYNLAMASFYQNDLEMSLSYALEADKAYGKKSDKVRTRIIGLIERIYSQQIGRSKNQNLLGDFTQLHKIASSQKENPITIEVLEKAAISSMSGEHHFYKKGLEKEKEIARGNEMREKGINPYEEKITLTPNGRMLVVFSFDEELTTIPNEIIELDLNELRVGGQSIETIPPNIGEMTNLKVLDLSGNLFKSIPSEIGNCVNMLRLNLSRNDIYSLPESIKNLKKLKVLNLKKTKFSVEDISKIQSWLPNCKIKF